MANTIAVSLPSLSVAIDQAFGLARLRQLVPSGLSDSALQLLLDSAFSSIEEQIGPPGELEEQMSASGDLLRLSRRATSISSVVEDARSSAVTLDPDDYQLSRSGYMLTRLRTGTHPGSRWRGRIRIAYVPIDNSANRNRVATELVKLNIAFAPALASQTIGTWSETYRTDVPYPEQRAAILASLESDTAWIR